MIALLMGVTASGKSTIANELVKETGWEFAEGDNYHSDANKAKMHAGTPLTDEDRAPWLGALHGVLAGWVRDGKNGIMTCSALKQSYRVTLESGLPADALRFVLLEVPRAELVRRLQSRKGHFMNPKLLDSQLATLENPGDALHIHAVGDPRAVAADILRQLGVAQNPA